MTAVKHNASCLCGKITIEVTGLLPNPTACHCTQCRKHSGHFEASIDMPTSTKLSRHIFVADKGDYYDIADGLPQNHH